jgi:hypothetical protein
MKFWSVKYIFMSWMLGLNASFLLYHAAFKHMKLYVGIPLTLIVFSQTKNLMFYQCLNKIYYPIEPLYFKVKKENRLNNKGKANTPDSLKKAD